MKGTINMNTEYTLVADIFIEDVENGGVDGGVNGRTFAF